MYEYDWVKIEVVQDCILFFVRKDTIYLISVHFIDHLVIYIVYRYL